MPEIRIALCAIAKKENRYLAEFVRYYRDIGFDHIYLYDNNDKTDERLEDAVPSDVASGFVDVIDCRGEHGAQIKAYNECYSRYGGKYDWMAFFDVDEFLTFSEKSGVQSAKEFLAMERFADSDVVCVNWMCYGDNGKLRYEPGSVIERFPDPVNFDRCAYYTFPENNHVESLLRGGKPLVWRGCNPHCPCSSDGTWRAHDAAGRPHAEGMPFCEYDFSLAYLRHYRTKTAEEFAENVQRGYALYATDELFMRCQIESKFFSINEKEPRRFAILAENIPGYNVGVAEPPVLLSMYHDRKAALAEAAGLKSRIVVLEGALESANASIATGQAEVAASRAEAAASRAEAAECRAEIAMWKAKYAEIATSTCWRITKPIRLVLDLVKRQLRRLR